MRRFYVIAPRIDGGAGPVEITEDEAKAKHAAGGEVFFADEGGALHLVPRVDAAAEAPEEAPAPKKRKG